MIQLFNILIAVLTVAMEAGGEPRGGKLAVAYVLFNRTKGGKSLSDVILQPQHFSCWDTSSPTRMNIDTTPDGVYWECLGAVLAAMQKLEPDPTGGAVFYLNKATVLASAGKLPAWWDIDGDPANEVTIGAHSFRRHR